MTTEIKKSKRGFAAMDPDRAKKLQIEGGQKLSQDRVYMSEMGKRGGAKVSLDKAHMAAIGKKGGSVKKEPKSGG